jgi:plastocyanin
VRRSSASRSSPERIVTAARTRRRALLAAAAGVACAPVAPVARAAAPAPLDIRVSDAAGKPLADAVVFLESAEAKARVKPLAGVEIAQAERRFMPAVSVVTVGSAVAFPNRDVVRHHVYSFSPAKRFEIKLYVGTPAAPVVFDQPGIAVLGCNIHDQMAAWVVIVETPWYGRTDADGRWAGQAPPGRYRLRAWHAGLPVGATPSDEALTVEAGGARAALRLAALQR